MKRFVKNFICSFIALFSLLLVIIGVLSPLFVAAATGSGWWILGLMITLPMLGAILATIEEP